MSRGADEGTPLVARRTLRLAADQIFSSPRLRLAGSRTTRKTTQPSIILRLWLSSLQRCQLASQGFSRKAQPALLPARSEEHTSELQSLMRISYAVFCLKKNK